MPVCRLRSKEDIESLTQAVRFFDRPASFRVELLCSTSIPVLRKRKLEKRLAFALSDCGCALASLSIVLTILLLYFVFDLSPVPVWPNTMSYILFVLVIASLAKLVSLYLTYHLAHTILHEILVAVTHVRPPQLNGELCNSHD